MKYLLLFLLIGTAEAHVSFSEIKQICSIYSTYEADGRCRERQLERQRAHENRCSDCMKICNTKRLDERKAAYSYKQALS